MNKELIIDSSSTEVVIALLEDKKLVELHKEQSNNNYSVGDLYLGKIKKIIPGLNAAFVDVGFEKDAFLHYLDLGHQIRSLNKFSKLAISEKKEVVAIEDFILEKDIEKTGKITNVLNPNQQIVVQIAKEPISNKGPRITSEIAIAGRYVVLVPFSNRISISQKIKNFEERNRLKRLVQSIKPNNFGVIIRTVAENKKVADLVKDLTDLIEKWENCVKNLQVAKAPKKIHGELDRTATILRDLLSESFNNVYINDSTLHSEIKNYISTIAPDKVDIVKLHKSKAPIFEHFGIDKQIKNSFGKKVSFKNGGYLIIEHTEALHVIDVNSGHRLKTDNSQESNATDVNIEAAIEIARQLRLRDMGGIIVIDFIDMHDRNNRKALFQKLSEEMKLDHAKHTILPPSKFGLVQITRQRVRPEMNIQILEKCPCCQGSGEVKASIVIVDELENNISYLIHEQNESYLKILCHPYIHAYLTKNLFSIQLKWYFKFKKWITIKPNSSYHTLEYRFFNKNEDEIKM
ncbi:MAG: Rne/Rng family ribonuclease [Saprospiraceae bacterium]|nr:Rne/Rng family ribonuclease [Saprospiraceae bacterium]